MDTLPPAHITEFVVQLLNTGHTIVGLVDSLAEALAEATGDPIDDCRHAVIAMSMGTIGVRLAATPPEEFTRATKLIAQALDVLIGDLERAARVSDQRERGIHTVRSSHG